MVGPFAILNENFVDYLRYFHVVRDHLERGLEPPEDMVEFLFEK